MQSIGEELGGPEKAKAMISAKGISMILKNISISYQRPVVFPDTVRIFSVVTKFLL